MYELRMTKDEPRHTTPMIARRDPNAKVLGVMNMKSIEDRPPIKPNATRSFFR
jgi:hypothetical protein